jgi:hypothetical protein
LGVGSGLPMITSAPMRPLDRPGNVHEQTAMIGFNFPNPFLSAVPKEISLPPNANLAAVPSSAPASSVSDPRPGQDRSNSSDNFGQPISQISAEDLHKVLVGKITNFCGMERSISNVRRASFSP